MLDSKGYMEGEEYVLKHGNSSVAGLLTLAGGWYSGKDIKDPSNTSWRGVLHTQGKSHTILYTCTYTN